MKIPSPSEFQEAFQEPALSLLDPELAAGEPRLNALGLPQPIAGAFAVVFSVDTPRGHFAARCFLTAAKDQEVRYAAIGRFLERTPLPFLTEFQYQKKGVRIGEEVFPLLKMKWVHGQPLNQYVALHLSRRQRIEELADVWLGLVRQMEEAGIAHGDLQHGNILVREGTNGEVILQLVDYDTMFVPELRGRSSPEIGHRNYQHSERSSRHFDPRLDRFSALVIYVALRALVLNPDLWSSFDTGENLLFQSEDFYRPAQSRLFAELSALEQVRTIAQALKQACLQDPLKAPTLDDAIRGMGAQSALPVQGRLLHAPQPGGRAGFEKAMIWVPPGIVVLSIALSFWTVRGGLAAFAGCSLGALLLLVARFATLDERRRRKRLADEIGLIRRIRTQLERELEMMEEERQRLLSDHEADRQRRLDQFRERVVEEALRYRFVGELEGVDGVAHKAVIKLKKAGIRTALHVSRSKLEVIQGLSPSTRERIMEWRDRLVAQLLRDAPMELPENELRRVERDTGRRRDVLAAEVDRFRQKVLVQADEEERVRARLDQTPAPSMGRYLAFVMRFSRTYSRTVPQEGEQSVEANPDTVQRRPGLGEPERNRETVGS